MRESFENFKSQYGCTNIVGAELGAGFGVNASGYCEEIQFSKLYLVENGTDGGYAYPTLLEDFCKDKPFTQILFKDSAEAASDITNESLDFVYVDADHSYEAVKRDINSWYSKLKSGGWMMFHDFNIYKLNEEVAGATREFANSHGLALIHYVNGGISEVSFRKP
jgi:hypothetical protein